MAPTPWLKPKPTTAPDDSYTRAIAQGGLGAVQQARQQLRYGVGGMQQNYADTGVASYAAPRQQGGDMFDQWLASVTPQGAGEYNYGRTEDGAYAGFKNEGTLKAALRGRAEQIRGDDRSRFSALDYLANQGLDQVAGQYGDQLAESGAMTRYERTIPTLADPTPQQPGSPSKPTVDPAWLAPNHQLTPEQEAAIRANGTDGGDTLDGIVGAVTQQYAKDQQQSTGAGLTRADAASADRYTAMAEQQAKKDYQFDELNPWLAQESAPLLEQQQFAQSGLAVPIAQYAQRAGAEYGVDPNIVGGWYPEASAINDARDLRELDYLQQTGMTSTDYEQALNALDRQTADQEAGQLDAQEQQIEDYGYQATGGVVGTGALASQVGLQPMDVVSILGSDAFQVYSNDINQALASRDETVVADTMAAVLDDAAYTDPALLNILQVVYKDYIPPDYEFLGA